MKSISYNKFVSYSIFLSIAIVIALFLITTSYFHLNNLEKSIKNDSKTLTNLIFQNVYQVMKSGGTKKEIEEVIKKIQSDLPNIISVKLIRNTPFEMEENIKKIFQDKNTNISKHNDHIDFSYPITYKQECLTCHTTSKVNEIAGYMLLEYPVLNLQISLKDTLIIFATFFLLSITVFFTIWYFFLKKYFVKPITSLAKQMNDISNHEDLKNSIKIDSSIIEIKEIGESFNLQNKKLLSSYNELKIISDTDALTGIFNRKKFDEFSNLAINVSKRYNEELAFIVADLNDFKFINDNYGHAIGDEVLKHFVEVVQNSIRASDAIFRVGGDEFVLMLTHSNSNGAKNLINKIEHKLIDNPYKFSNKEIIIQASFGYAEFNIDSDNVENLLKIADKRMYQDKKTKKC